MVDVDARIDNKDLDLSGLGVIELIDGAVVECDSPGVGHAGKTPRGACLGLCDGCVAEVVGLDDFNL